MPARSFPPESPPTESSPIDRRYAEGGNVSPWRFAQAWPRVPNRCYVASKIATDPLYPAAFGALRECALPLLDIGCGMGVFAFYLRGRGWQPAILAIDYDE